MEHPFLAWIFIFYTFNTLEIILIFIFIFICVFEKKSSKDMKTKLATLVFMKLG